MTARPLALRIALRFPTTLVLTAPYAVLFLPTAIWNDNPGTDFIIATGGIAIGAAFLVEAAIGLVAYAERRSLGGAVVRPDRQTAVWDPARVAAIARFVAGLSLVANLTSVFLGGGTLRAQVDSAVPSGALSILSPFVSWSYIAVALLMTARHLGGMTWWATMRWLGLLLAAQGVMAYVTNLTARATVFLVLLVTLALLTRIARPLWIAVAGGVCAAVWPTVFAIRNQLRAANGIVVNDSVSATDRLRFDEQIARAAQYGAGHDLGQPDAWSALRYGFLPRFLDPGRPTVSSGNLINEFLGGSSFSSYTFLPVATAWFFWGTLTVAMLYGGYALVVMLLRPWRAIERRPIALIVLALMLGGPLSWFSTPPDVVMNMLQTFVSATPVFLVLWLWARAPSGRTASTPVPTQLLTSRPVARR